MFRIFFTFKMRTKTKTVEQNGITESLKNAYHCGNKPECKNEYDNKADKHSKHTETCRDRMA